MMQSQRGRREPTQRFREAAPPLGSETWTVPWVQLKYHSNHPTIYPAMIRAVSPNAKAGDLVTVYDKEGQRFGGGLYNPSARVPLRVIYHGTEPIDDDYFIKLLDRSLELRLNWFNLPEQTDAFRAVSSDGDNLSGLTVDKYGDVLSVEVHSLGIYQRLPGWLKLLHERLGTSKEVIHVEPHVARLEGIKERHPTGMPPRSARIREHGIRYEVNFETGHKTGFFCDQRDNRLKLSRLVKGARVLDLCCYTGGFSIAAAALGGAEEVTGVDLDEKAIEQAKRNANLNQARINWVHCDAFSYARQLQRNKERRNVIILDPPKFVEDRETMAEDFRKYEDLNVLGLSLLEPGGLLVTCSCSGLVTWEDFEQILIRAAHRMGKRLQFLDRTGAGPDHPVMSNCLESRYLKVIWTRVF